MLTQVSRSQNYIHSKKQNKEIEGQKKRHAPHFKTMSYKLYMILQFANHGLELIHMLHLPARKSEKNLVDNDQYLAENKRIKGIKLLSLKSTFSAVALF